MSLEASVFGNSHFVDFEPEPPNMEALITDYLSTNPNATFVDMEEDIPGFAGELTLRDSRDRTTILWRGVSAAAVCALYSLERGKKLVFRPVSHHVYQKKGRRIQLPVVRGKQSRWRWSPVAVNLVG